MATRCCCPPESCDGSDFHRAPRPTFIQQFLRLRQGLRARHAVDEQRNGHVLGGVQRGEQVEGLEDKPDVLAAVLCALAVAHVLKVLIEHDAVARVVIEDPRDHRDQRRLPRARGPHEHHEFVGVDVQIHAAQRLHLGVAGAVDLGHALAVDRYVSFVHVVHGP
jgi:hypothetical protein